MTINSNITRLVSSDNKVKAYATVYIDDAFQINDVKVVEGKNGLFVSLPQRSYENKEGKQVYKDIVSCTNDDVKGAISKCVLGSYELALEEAKEDNNQEVPFEQTM